MIPTTDDPDSGASLNETNQTTCLLWGGGGGAIKLRESNWNSVDPEQLGNQLYNK